MRNNRKFCKEGYDNEAVVRYSTGCVRSIIGLEGHLGLGHFFFPNKSRLEYPGTCCPHRPQPEELLGCFVQLLEPHLDLESRDKYSRSLYCEGPDRHSECARSQHSDDRKRPQGPTGQVSNNTS